MAIDSVNSATFSLPGLSGYDFSGIVDKMVEMYKMPEIKMNNSKNLLQIQKDAWRDVNTRLASLEKTLAALRDAPTWTATKASSGNEEVVKVSSTSNATKGAYMVDVMQMAQAQTVVSNVQTVADPDTAVSGLVGGSFKIIIGGDTENAKTVTVADGVSLSDIADAINNAKAGIAATIVKVGTDQFQLALTDSETGEENVAAFEYVSGGNVLNTLGITDTSNVIQHKVQEAKNAILSINGISNIVSQTNTVKDAVLGVTLDIKGTTFDALGVRTDQPVTVSIAADYQKAQDAVKSFVDQYNSTMDFIAGKLSYDKDTQKAGDLFGDPMLQSIQARLRGIASSTLNTPTGPYTSLSAIGISTSAADYTADNNYGQSAKLTFDTAKFNEAMAANPQSAANLFGAPYEGVTPATTTTSTASAQGLANILEEYLNPLVMYQGSLAKTQDHLGKQIEDITERISAFEERAKAYEEQTKLKFSRLETVLAGLNAQNAWLTSQVNLMTAQAGKK